MQPTTALEAIVSTYLDVDSTDLEAAAKWARSTELPESSQKKRDSFKAELARSLVKPNTVTREIYERWTNEDLDTQQEVQDRLQELWDVCFGIFPAAEKPADGTPTHPASSRWDAWDKLTGRQVYELTQRIPEGLTDDEEKAWMSLETGIPIDQIPDLY